MPDKCLRTKNLTWNEILNNVFEKKCLVKKAQVKISILKIKPHKLIPLHKHQDTRYNFILKGSMSDDKQTYKEGDFVTNKKGSSHFLKAGPKGCEFLLIWT